MGEMSVNIQEYTNYNETEILALYSSVGWSGYTNNPQLLRLGFENSLLILGAYEDNRLVGIIRAVGDGHTIIFVQDLLVHPQYQRRGIGKTLLQTLLDKYRQVRQIELVADESPELTVFYQTVGFKKLNDFGCCGFMRLFSNACT